MDPWQEYTEARQSMVADQIRRRGLRNKRLLDVLRRVPRHCFVPPDRVHMAYSDGPLQIGYGQTISQPYIVALMTDLLRLDGSETVLEIGTGSGYQAAILGLLAKEVHTIERHAPLAENAESILRNLGIENIHVHVGDGTLGLKEQAPYDGILITAGAPEVPKPLLDQLADSGRLVLPVGNRFSQMLETWQRDGDDFKQEAVTAVAFVPLLGEHGWDEDDWEKFRFW